jgi:hypothetical protein
MTLQALADHVVRRVGVTDDDTKDLAKEFLKRRWKSIYDQRPWLDSHNTFTLTAGTSNEIILPNWTDKVVQVRVDNASAARNLQMVSRQTVLLVAPGALDDKGARTAYSPLPTVATHTHPAGEKLVLSSTSGSDTTQECRIKGLFNGLEVEETIMLVGMTDAPSQFYYDEITHFSKPPTQGSVTLRNDATIPLELQILRAQDTERRHLRIQLHYDYEDNATEEVISVLCKRRCPEMVHNNDTPSIANLDDALIAYAVADILERERQFGKAAAKVQEALALTNEMVLAERDQRQDHQQIIPVIYDYAEQSALY